MTEETLLHILHSQVSFLEFLGKVWLVSKACGSMGYPKTGYIKISSFDLQCHPVFWGADVLVLSIWSGPAIEFTSMCQGTVVSLCSSHLFSWEFIADLEGV